MIPFIQNIFGVLEERFTAYTKIIRFLISGGTSTGVDLAFLFFFTDVLGIWYLASAVAAFIIAFFVSFGLQKFWTFRDHSRDGMHAQAGIYFLVASGNLIFNTLLVYLFVERFGSHYLLAQIVASLIIAGESFFVYQKFIFHRKAV